MDLQDYLMSDEDKAKLIAKLEQDISLEDELDQLSYEGEAKQNEREIDDEIGYF